MSTSSKPIGDKSKILIDYQIIHQDQILEQSECGEPIEYTMGQGQWPMQLELAMHGELKGARLNCIINASEDIFGAADPARVIQMALSDFDDEPQLDELIEFELPDGEIIEGQVLAILGDQIEVDFNHPYAGRDLMVKIAIQAVLS